MATDVSTLTARACEEGNAIRLDFVFPSDAIRLRVLRKVGSDPSGPADASAVVVSDSTPERFLATDLRASSVFVIDNGFQVPASGDPAGLVNGTAYHYAIYTHDGAGYSSGKLVTVTPALAAGYVEVDAKRLLMERLEVSMRELYAAGGFVFSDAANVSEIAVYSSYPRIGEVMFPLVSVHRDGDQEVERALGDYVGERVASIGGEAQHESLFGRVRRIRFSVLGWSQDPDQRDVLSRLIMAALRINLGLFAEMGFADVTVSASDAEDFMTFETPMYYATFEVSGLVHGLSTRRATSTVSGSSAEGETDYQTFG